MLVENLCGLGPRMSKNWGRRAIEEIVGVAEGQGMRRGARGAGGGTVGKKKKNQEKTQRCISGEEGKAKLQNKTNS